MSSVRSILDIEQGALGQPPPTTQRLRVHQRESRSKPSPGDDIHIEPCIISGSGRTYLELFAYPANQHQFSNVKSSLSGLFYLSEYSNTGVNLYIHAILTPRCVQMPTCLVGVASFHDSCLLTSQIRWGKSLGVSECSRVLDFSKEKRKKRVSLTA